MTNNLYIVIPGLIILIVFILPWYCQQLGRFFAKGIIDFIVETLDIRMEKQFTKTQKESKNG